MDHRLKLFISIGYSAGNYELSVGSVLERIAEVKVIQVKQNQDQTQADVEIDFEYGRFDLNSLVEQLSQKESSIRDMIIHFPSTLTGVSDAYKAGAYSMLIEEQLKQLQGAVNGSLNSKGVLIVTMDTGYYDKQNVIDSIIRNVLNK